MEEKEKDRRFIQAEGEKYEVEHQNRQRYFNKLKEYQKANELKNKMLQRYISQDEAILNSTKDEKAYIKHIEEEEKRAIQKEISEKQLKFKKNKDNYNVLDQQIREKEMIKIRKKQNEEIMAQQLTEDVNRELRELDIKNKEIKDKK